MGNSSFKFIYNQICYDYNYCIFQIINRKYIMVRKIQLTSEQIIKSKQEAWFTHCSLPHGIHTTTWRATLVCTRPDWLSWQLDADWASRRHPTRYCAHAHLPATLIVFTPLHYSTVCVNHNLMRGWLCFMLMQPASAD